MAQRVKEMVSEEIIDESTIKKEVEKAKKELKKEIEEAKEESSSAKATEDKEKKKRPKKSVHGKKYFAAKAKIEPDKVYSIDEAIDKVLETSTINFDATIEVHAKLAVANIRGTIIPPSGAPKQKKVAEVTDATVDDIVTKIKAGKQLHAGIEKIGVGIGSALPRHANGSLPPGTQLREQALRIGADGAVAAHPRPVL